MGTARILYTGILQVLFMNIIFLIQSTQPLFISTIELLWMHNRQWKTPPLICRPLSVGYSCTSCRGWFSTRRRVVCLLTERIHANCQFWLEELHDPFFGSLPRHNECHHPSPLRRSDVATHINNDHPLLSKLNLASQPLLEGYAKLKEKKQQLVRVKEGYLTPCSTARTKQQTISHDGSCCRMEPACCPKVGSLIVVSSVDLWAIY